ncbi:MULTISPECIES: DUF6527 family protein [Pseudomonas]|uniref:DUF6527 family protein n=1 Tax=Pseudomonas TaxID=286 RepID=UPI0009E492D2|nr:MULTISPECIES: DUF6527 family protein [Pseudomonas]MDD1981335.1 DUF6527 family protein [Pseudomonas asiatica]MDG9890303.1 DUF6527 family protein [Pseudomonas juntendi]
MTIQTIGRCLGRADDGSLWFFCRGCNLPHSLNVGPGTGPRWGYNGNAESPTFTPSVLSRYRMADKEVVCHSFVTDGRIQYLGDCTHKLAGQTVDLPDWEEAWSSW